jgi:hypothetical protein
MLSESYNDEYRKASTEGRQLQLKVATKVKHDAEPKRKDQLTPDDLSYDCVYKLMSQMYFHLGCVPWL